MVQKDELSKRTAAERLEPSRPSIHRALDRGEFSGCTYRNIYTHKFTTNSHEPDLHSR